MNTLDVRGLSCPIPVLKTQKALAKGITELQIIGSGNVSKENVSKLAKSQGYRVTVVSEDPNQWTMNINK